MAKKKTKSIQEVLSKVKNLADGVTSEKIEPYYYDLSTLKYPPEPLYRLDFKDYRMYYRMVEDMPEFYTSVTTMIKNALPTPKGLIKWMANTEDSEEFAMERAAYGTFMHDVFGQILVYKKYDLDKLASQLQVFSIKENIPYKEEWVNELKKDALAFAQFVIDRNVKPLAIEICLYHPNDGYAGAVDLVAQLDFNRKRVTAIIDFKSGRKGFYESHEIQLRAYKNMWEFHFRELPIDMTFNFSPKDWRSKPSYNLKDQTDSKNADKLPHLVALSKIQESSRDKTVVSINGTLDLAKGVEQNISEKTLIELVR